MVFLNEASSVQATQGLLLKSLKSYPANSAKAT